MHLSRIAHSMKLINQKIHHRIKKQVFRVKMKHNDFTKKRNTNFTKKKETKND